ncbi:hypothetical protein OIU84_014965 [Salix udensis]|uniref:Uncharacterized protein n=1 Tax=Salix udensis TaxID=889485 RepID=A0AAD6NS64_9ROSI|nr:hypothetical protein OIU84_014965 [Salix udensis]
MEILSPVNNIQQEDQERRLVPHFSASSAAFLLQLLSGLEQTLVSHLSSSRTIGFLVSCGRFTVQVEIFHSYNILEFLMAANNLKLS